MIGAIGLREQLVFCRVGTAHHLNACDSWWAMPTLQEEIVDTG